MKRLIIIILIFLSSNLFADEIQDNTFVITDSLLQAHCPPSPGVIFPALASGLPGMGNFALPIFSLFWNTNTELATGLFLIASVSYPFYVGHGINKIRKYNEKQRLLHEYSNYKILDKSRIKKETTPSFYIHYGLHHSYFDSFNSDFKISWSCGLTFNYPFSKYISCNTGLFFLRHNIPLKNKIYRPESSPYSDTYSLIDVDYKGADITFPIGIQLTFFRKNNYSLFVAFDYTTVLNSHQGKVKTIDTFIPEDEDEYDFSYYEKWFAGFNEELIYSFGINAQKYQFKIRYTNETNIDSRGPGNYVYIFDRINVFELQFGYRIY